MCASKQESGDLRMGPLDSAGATGPMPSDPALFQRPSLYHAAPNDGGLPGQPCFSLSELWAVLRRSGQHSQLMGNPGSCCCWHRAQPAKPLLVRGGRVQGQSDPRAPPCISAARLRRPFDSAAELLDRFGSLGAVMAADPDKLAQVLKEDRVSVILLKAVHASVKAIVREPLEDRPVISSASALMDYLSVPMRRLSQPRGSLLSTARTA